MKKYTWLVFIIAPIFDLLDALAGVIPILDEIPSIIGPVVLFGITRDSVFIGGTVLEALRGLGAPVDEPLEWIPANTILAIYWYKKKH